MSDFKTTWLIRAGEDGAIDWGSEANLYRLREWLRNHPNKVLRVTPIKEFRTIQQNRFYWLYLGIISQETGDDENSLHEYFKRVHLPPKWIKALGKEVRVPRSTTELNKAEMGEYMDRICAECGVPIPDPKQLEGYIPN